MAWEYVNSIDGFNGSNSYSTDDATSWETVLNTLNNSGVFYQLSNRSNTFVYVSGKNSYSYNTDGSTKYTRIDIGADICFKANNANGSGGSFWFATNYNNFSPGMSGLMANGCCRIVINHSIQEAEICLLVSFYNQPWFTCVNCIMYYNQSDRRKFYNYLMNYLPNWQSVTSLTGKGKTVQLSTLNDINDGEEVITDDTSKFNLTTASNLVTLVQN